MEPYIEIVHINYEQATIGSKFNSMHASKQQRIIDLYDKNKANYVLELNETLSGVSPDTPIVLGGAIGSVCVAKRKQQLELQGFKNVSIDDTITVFMEELTIWN